jgi:hypothetical protein
MAYDYFTSLGVTEIVHEPDGNVPPDLLIGNKIAVEVRRLNQFFKNQNDEYVPLENLSYGVMKRIHDTIRSYEYVKSESTAWVGVDFERPLVLDKQLNKDLKTIFDCHLNCLDEQRVYIIRDNLKLRFRKAHRSFNVPFKWASSSDGDSGGAVVSNVLESLKIVIPEKEKKILPYKANYDIWWLAVIDKVAFSLDDIDHRQLKAAFDIKTFFQKIIIISAFNATSAVVLE